MSNENENEDLTAFERALAALRPRADGLDPAWRSLLAKRVSLTAGRRDRAGGLSQFSSAENGTVPLGVRPLGKTARCDHPAGHRFVCLHCGSDAPRAGGGARWAWPGALAAMTSLAAVLLAMVLVGRHGQTIGREGTPIAIGRPAPASRAAKPVEGQWGQETLTPVPDTYYSSCSPLAWRWRDSRRVLTAADTELGEDLPARGHLPARRTAAHAVPGDVSLSNSEFLRRLLLLTAPLARDGRGQ